MEPFLEFVAMLGFCVAALCLQALIMIGTVLVLCGGQLYPRLTQFEPYDEILKKI